jgi:alkanesulfonate monooxygenase SsuD/methylene tetrahydromethanopterin reductase-like flavin-dependent oxidoreductase (luciferase family)
VAPVRFGMTMPVMEPDLDREGLERWSLAIEAGPWSTLAFGERMAFTNPEIVALLGACAAWTRRVALVTTILIPTIHDPVWLAKSLATVDVLSRGRLRVGVGVGGREEDYAAVSADVSLRRHAELARRVAIMRRVWAGEKVVPGLLSPVGPEPVQRGGPPLLSGAQGPKAIEAAARWADGVSGWSFGPDPKEIEGYFALVRKAWSEAGRPAPHLATAFWYALGPGAREQVQRHLRRYLNWLAPRDVEAMLPTTGFAGTPAELRALLRRLGDTGADEIVLVPTTSDPDEVARAAECLP